MTPILIYCTVPNKKEAQSIARILVENKLAACVSMIDKVQSIFSWNDQICEENEILLIIKTKQELFEKVESTIKTLHSYNVPEVIGLPIQIGSQDYLDWIKYETL